MTCSYRLPISSAALAGLILLAGCASTAAPASTADATSGEMAAFDEVVVAAPLEVTLSGAADHGVVVTADDDDADLVRITVDGGTLSLELDGDLSTRPAVAVSLPRADLARLEVAEAALVSTRDAVASPRLEVTTSGGSTARLDTDGVAQLSVTAQDGSTVTVAGTGTAETLDAVASGSSTLTLFDIPAAHVTAEARDGSTVEVTATERLVATASEVSTLTYRGSPDDVSQDATEISTITSD